ncbi:hypothetical protein GCM10020331_080010 [Ectobacillus funiculus]
MTSPVIATAAIINMIYNWNEFVFVNTFISSDSYKTLTVGIQKLYWAVYNRLGSNRCYASY